VLHNLLTNAVEALEGEPDAKISVATHLAVRGDIAVAEIDVEDNGPGFQFDLIGQIFDPYVTTKPKGTGLGLAIVKKIVDEHRGRVAVENTPPRGARITLIFPAVTTAGAAAAA